MAINKKDYHTYGPFKVWTIENFPFIEADFDAITNYQLYSKIVEHMRKLQANQNILQEANNELIEAFNSLESYVNDYFDNLDVQEEINNKLDEMAEDGTLEELITEYINLKSILSYDNIADMKEATNLVDGSFVQTYGYYNVNDGGAAKYKVREVTNADTVDEIFLIALTNESLVAELILNDNYINVNQAGLKADDENFDNGELLENLINKCNEKGLNIEFGTGIYNFDTPISISDRLESMTIKGQGLPYTDYHNGTTLRYTGSGWFFTFWKLWKSTISNLQIESAENGIDFTDHFFMSHLNTVTLKNCKNGILLEQFAYGYLDYINIDTNNENSEYALKVGNGSTGTTEYLYVNYFTTQDDNIHIGNNGIVIDKGTHISLNHMDFVKKNQAILVKPQGNCRFIEIDDVDFTRCHIAINLDAKTYGESISMMSLHDIRCAFKENPDATDRFMIISRTSGAYINDLEMSSIGVVALDGNPDYAIEQTDSGAFRNCKLALDWNNYNIPSKILLNSSFQNPLVSYYQPLKNSHRFTNSSGATSGTITLLTNSPFSATPFVAVTSNKPYIKSYSVSNTNGGNLTITFEFTEDYTSGTLDVFTNITDGTHSSSTL